MEEGFEVILQSPNDHVVYGAYLVQQCVYPPRCEDKINQSVYEEKHCAAFLAALAHDSAHIRAVGTNAAKKVAFFWNDLARDFRNKFVAALMKLFYDAQMDVRHAAFKVGGVSGVFSRNLVSSLLRPHPARAEEGGRRGAAQGVPRWHRRQQGEGAAQLSARHGGVLREDGGHGER